MKATALRRAFRGPVAKLLLVTGGLALCVEVFASITWVLSGAGSVDLAALESVRAPERHPTQAKALHAVGEWDAGSGIIFQEAPQRFPSERAIVRVIVVEVCNWIEYRKHRRYMHNEQAFVLEDPPALSGHRQGVSKMFQDFLSTYHIEPV